MVSSLTGSTDRAGSGFFVIVEGFADGILKNVFKGSFTATATDSNTCEGEVIADFEDKVFSSMAMADSIFIDEGAAVSRVVTSARVSVDLSLILNTFDSISVTTGGVIGEVVGVEDFDTLDSTALSSDGIDAMILAVASIYNYNNTWLYVLPQ